MPLDMAAVHTLARQTIDATERELRRLQAYLAQLSEADWNRGTMCTGWTVADAAGHLEMTNRWFTACLVDGLRGGPKPAWPNGMDAWIDEEVARRKGRPVATALREVNASCEELIATERSIPPDQYEKAIPHPRGDRLVWLYFLFCLDEIAVHQWDIQAYADPTYLPTPEAQELLGRFRFNLATRWLWLRNPDAATTPAAYHFVLRRPAGHELIVAIGNGERQVQPKPAPPIDATITVEPWTLVLLTYGRRTFADALACGEVELSGNLELARRAAVLFS